jgi:bifunctional oligoribonuclease and PAP phosphatase NrnA
MVTNEKQQILETLGRSERILIVFKSDWNGDAVSASLSWAEFLKKMDKKVDIACSGFKANNNLSYLPTSWIKPKLDSLQKLILTVDLGKTGLKDFEYDKQESKLSICLAPEKGQFSQQDINISYSSFKYDLIFLINTPDLESVGSIYEKAGDFFYSTPKINLDHLQYNEYYGNINLVNLACSSSSEVIYELIDFINKDLIDENIATYLLSGIISATKNFKTNDVTPKTLDLAGKLIDRGARREQIIQNLYQSRFISTLKLWGRVLSRLRSDLNGRLVWSVLSSSDFLETASNIEELPEVVEELIFSMPNTEIAVLIFEIKRDEVLDSKVMIYSFKNHNALLLAGKFTSVGNNDLASFVLSGTSLAEAEKQVIAEIKQVLDKN